MKRDVKLKVEKKSRKKKFEYKLEKYRWHNQKTFKVAL